MCIFLLTCVSACGSDEGKKFLGKWEGEPPKEFFTGSNTEKLLVVEITHDKDNTYLVDVGLKHKDGDVTEQGSRKLVAILEGDHLVLGNGNHVFIDDQTKVLNFSGAKLIKSE